MLPDATALTVGRLEKQAIELLLEADADAVVDRRRKSAERHAEVRVYPSPTDGMSTIAADLPTDVAAACHAVVDILARMLKADGDPRPIAQLRTAVFADLLQRPWQTGTGVTAHMQIITTLAALAGRSTEAGEVNGLPITAAHLRALLHELDALGVQPPVSGSVTVALTDDDGGLRATAMLDRLRRPAARGCPDHPGEDPTGVDPAGGECGCAVLDRPDEVDRYTPSAAQQVIVRTRDRTCRFPTCGQRVGWADADHVVPHAHGGATDCANLCCLCRSHHRVKTFARGWRSTMAATEHSPSPPHPAPPAPPGHRACDHHRRTRNHLERTSRPTRTTTPRRFDRPRESRVSGRSGRPADRRRTRSAARPPRPSPRPPGPAARRPRRRQPA
ncbi:HNH endonuclease [Geodermatophilus saharensis]|uniref:HNH endonuclease n=1 Tax=Geodermatophilus saharensis TaxID=1137994 RepID=A0A239BPI4_9ACTN|nr:HNH endonuclease [Geodermatophilus saharensis]